MNRRFVVLFIATLSVIVTVLAYVILVAPHYPREEHVGGKYQCTIEITGLDLGGFEVGKISYIKDGVEHIGYWGGNMRNVLDWIRDNTPDDSVFLNWWDYGHMIVGYAERESASKNPSEEALISVNVPSEIREFDNDTIIVDVARALTTTNEDETLAIMSKYNANYILIASEDGKAKAHWIFRFAELNYTDYLNASWNPTDLPFDADQYNELGNRTVLCRALTNAHIDGLTLIYSDEYFTIYRRIK